MPATTPQFGRDLFIGLLIVSLIIAPFGCTITAPPIDTGGDTAPKTGLFLNDDQGSPLLMAGLAESGDAYFVYGTRDSSGNPTDIQAIVVRQADGAESNVVFDYGRPTSVTGPDGSQAKIRYDTVAADRLAGAIAFFNAADGSTTNFTFDINPAATADQVAALVKQQTGVDIDIPSASAAGVGALEKSSNRSSALFVILWVIPLFLTVALITVVLGQVFAKLFAAVGEALQATLIIVFLPVFLIAKLFNETVPTITIRPLFPIFGTPPHNPHDSGL